MKKTDAPVATAGNPTRSWVSGSLLCAILIPFLALCVLRFSGTYPSAEIENDCYYHVMMADLFPDVCIAKQFPYTSMSIWSEHFYDKELGFHAFLSAVRRYNQILGLSLDPPFHVSALTLSLLVVSTFALAVFAFRIPNGFAYAMLFVIISPFFVFRLSMVRPHNLAIILMLLYCLHLRGILALKDLWKPFCFGFLFSYCYSNPHFVLVPAVIYSAILWRNDRRVALGLTLATAGGVAAGLLIHPQFPNTFVLWKIQSVLVIQQMLFKSLSVYGGNELAAPSPFDLLENSGVFLFSLISLAGFVVLMRQRKKKGALAPETVLLFVLQLLFVLLFIVSKRAIEYAVPFSLLSTGLICRDLQQSGFFNRFSSDRLAKITRLCNLLLVALLCLVLPYQIKYLRSYYYPEYRSFSEWAGKYLPDGTHISNLFWGDFPMLFYGAPQFRYSMGLDPMFGYYKNPKQVETLEKFRTREIKLTPAELEQVVGARFAFVPYRADFLAKAMAQDGFAMVYGGKDGWLFDLDPHPVRPEPEKPKKKTGKH